MNLVRLMYASRMAKGVDPDGLTRILDASKRNNAALGVTGVLCYSPAGFLQVLEGPPEAVNELYRRIVRDRRNEEATLLAYAETSRRRFPEWSMAYFRGDGIDRALLRGLTSEKAFDPMAMTAAEALRFLTAVATERRRFLQQSAGDE